MIRLLPVDPSLHRPLMAGWLRRDHVSRWWGDPARRLEQFDATPPSDHRLIASDGEPVGYVRWERIDPAALTEVGLTGIPAGAIDMDIFIGDPAMCGQGVGPAALRLVFHHLDESTDAPMIGLCTSVRNFRAHTAFENSGCERIAQFADSEFGPCYVYARQRSARSRTDDLAGGDAAP